ncbi:transposase, partial [Palleronia aestuarii]
ALAATRLLVERVVTMVRNGTAGDLTAWLDEAETSEIASCTRGLAADQAAVVAALTEPWSSGQIEGQIDRLKTLKRQIYGRANIELLKARLVAAS